MPCSWKSETTVICIVKLPSRAFSFCNQHPFGFGKSRKPLLEEFEGVTLNLEGISMDAGVAAVLSTSDGIFNLANLKNDSNANYVYYIYHM